MVIVCVAIGFFVSFVVGAICGILLYKHKNSDGDLNLYFEKNGRPNLYLNLKEDPSKLKSIATFTVRRIN